MTREINEAQRKVKKVPLKRIPSPVLHSSPFALFAFNFDDTLPSSQKNAQFTPPFASRSPVQGSEKTFSNFPCLKRPFNHSRSQSKHVFLSLYPLLQ